MINDIFVKLFLRITIPSPYSIHNILNKPTRLIFDLVSLIKTKKNHLLNNLYLVLFDSQHLEKISYIQITIP